MIGHQGNEVGGNMEKIILNKVSYHYEDFYNPVYENIDLVIKTDWKLGLIGRNGRGKTTLLRLLKGELEPTSGKMNVPVEVEYFPYKNECGYTITRDIIKENVAQLKSMEDTMDAIISANDESRFDEYSHLQEQYLELDGYEMESMILKEMDDIGLDSELLDREFESLSGGEKTRIMLLTLFLRKKTFVLMDEPTNHLDDEGKEAVIAYLQKKKGFIVVSHDRAFLDQVIDHVLSINKKDITIEKGNYSSWKHNKDKREAYELRTKERLEEEIAQMERSAKTNRFWGELGNAQRYQFAGNGRANGVETYMRQAKRSETRVQEHIDQKKQLLQNYEEVKALVMEQKDDIEEKCLIKIKELTFKYPDGTKQVIKGFNFEVHAGERIWVKGKNGAGKSTFLKLLSGRIQNEAIEYADGLQIAMVSQEPEWKKGYIKEAFEDRGLEVIYQRFLELCDYFELPDDFLKRPLETYSSGELKKINIAKALAEENHIILFDEPLNYMDTYFSEQLERAILEYQPTIIFVEHDAYFGKTIATKTIQL
ncbi:MAG: ABC-F family ATP-binding cassette domain-containing protein [Cellulosilyticum sp.]|nr:ABC-F family ATP-binding cassette domain-containing protein [Cellulosilyticum sp.]